MLELLLILLVLFEILNELLLAANDVLLVLNELLKELPIEFWWYILCIRCRCNNSSAFGSDHKWSIVFNFVNSSAHGPTNNELNIGPSTGSAKSANWA